MHLDVFNEPTVQELRAGGYYEGAKKIVLWQIVLGKPLKNT
ncbi:MAG: hypothetical protein QXX99_08235 [Candidatus Bathyarchaeia archaeon]